MGQRVGVDAGVGERVGVRPRLGREHLRVRQVRRRLRRGGELRGELAEGAVLAARLDQAERGDVPECGRTAVAEDHLVAVRQGEELGEAARARGRRRRARRPGGGRCRGRSGRRRRGRRFLRCAPSRVRSRTARPSGGAPSGSRLLPCQPPSRPATRPCRRVSSPFVVCASMAGMAASPHITGAASEPARRISRRVGAVAPSATLAIDAKAKAMKAEGLDVVGFGAGEPDFPTPEAIVEAAVPACRDPRNHRYTPTAGLPELREAIADKTARDSGLVVAPSQVLVTNGGKHAIANAFATLLDPGDEVLLPAPYWTTYPEAIAPGGWRPGRRRRRTARAGFQGDGRAARGTPPRSAPSCCCSSRRPTRPGPSTHARRSRRSAAWRSSAAGGCSPTRSTSTSSTTGSSTTRCRSSCRSSPSAASSSTAWRRPTP